MNELYQGSNGYDIHALSDEVRSYIGSSISQSSLKAYRTDLKVFKEWCDQKGVQSIPSQPHIIAEFLAHQAGVGRKASTIDRRIAAIRYAHEMAGFNSPTNDPLVKKTLKGIKRSLGTKPNKKRAVTIEILESMLSHCDISTTTGVRDKLILVMGFSGAFRRSELVALKVDDIDFVEQGLKVHIPFSKTDQEQAGRCVAILSKRLNLKQLLVDWLKMAGIKSGSVFRRIRNEKIGELPINDKLVATIVKRYAEKAGYDPSEFAGHSLRSGFITTAAERGENLFKIMEVSGHTNLESVRGYVIHAELFNNHAGDGFL